MKMNRDYRPEIAVSDDDCRFNLQHPYLDTEKKLLVATNGRLLVAVPVEPDEDEKSGHVRAELLEIARKDQPWRGDAGAIEIVGGGVHLGGKERVSWSLPGDLKFPDWAAVIPDFREGAPGTVTFGVSAKYLMDAAHALGCSSSQIAITVSVVDRTAPVLIRRVSQDRDPAELAVLMPVAIETPEVK